MVAIATIIGYGVGNSFPLSRSQGFFDTKPDVNRVIATKNMMRDILIDVSGFYEPQTSLSSVPIETGKFLVWYQDSFSAGHLDDFVGVDGVLKDAWGRNVEVVSVNGMFAGFKSLGANGVNDSFRSDDIVMMFRDLEH